jgi:multiple sugar transport system substrate-binding protein
MTELASKSGRFDIWSSFNAWIPSEAATGEIVPMDDYISKAGASLDWNDVLPKQRQMFSYKNSIYGIPFTANALLLAYRTDSLADAGLTLPPDGVLTADTYRTMTQTLTKGGAFGADFFTLPFVSYVELWASVFASAGGRFFDEKMNPQFDSAEAQVTSDFIQSLLPFAPPDVQSYTNVEANEIMQRGLAHTQIMWGSRIPSVFDATKSKVVGKVDWTLLPFKGLGGSSVPVGQTVNDGWGFAIPKAGQNKQEAFDFAVWAVDKQRQAKFVTDFSVPPTRSSVFEDPNLVSKNGWLKTMESQLNNAFDFPRIPEWTEIIDKAGAAFNAALSGQMSTKQANQTANDAAVQVLKEHGYPVGTYSGATLPWDQPQ